MDKKSSFSCVVVVVPVYFAFLYILKKIFNHPTMRYVSGDDDGMMNGGENRDMKKVQRKQILVEFFN